MKNYELKAVPQEYMEMRYPKIYRKFHETLKRISSEELRAKLNSYYLRMVPYYSSDFTERDTNSFCRQLEELNSSELEYYLEFCLEFHEKDFDRFMLSVCFTCREVNSVAKEINGNYLRYSGRKDREELANRISAFVPVENNPDLNECLSHIVEIEKKLIFGIYETARKGSSYVKKDGTAQ